VVALAESVQLGPLGKLPECAGAACRLTVPVGVVAVPLPVSDTVAVHVVVACAKSVLGLHDRVVEVERAATTQVKVVLALAPWASVAVTVTVEVPALEDVPEMVPVELSIERPAGNPTAV
jgi:hypothetical protein